MWVSNSTRATRVAQGRGPLTAESIRETKPRYEPISRRLVSIFPRSLAAALVFGIPIAAQSPGVPIPQPGLDHGQSSSRFPTQPPDDNDPASLMQAKRFKALNQMRHKAMVDDAGKLLALAQELNDESANISPAERIRKAAEIEKLAKSVKDKMTYALGGEPLSPKFSTVTP
jgi:hypothetical protein